MKQTAKRGVTATIMGIVLSGSLTLHAEQFQFRFSYSGQTWENTVTAKDWKAALNEASQNCLNHFTSSQKNPP